MFRHLSISAKLWAAVAALIVAMTGTVAIAAWRSVSQQQAAEAALRISDDKLRSASEWAELSKITITRVVAATLSSDPFVGQTFAKGNAQNIADITKMLEHIKSLPLTAADEAQLAEVQ